MSREDNIQQLEGRHFDVLVVGGGINGAVSAAALAGKGAKVALVDRSDFASGASSQSSNLAWGGIKYLENGEIRLVSKLCRSRNQLMREYPSSVKEIRFLTTVRKGFRMPPFFVYLGAVFYWLLGAFTTQPPRYLSRRRIKEREPCVDTSDALGGLEHSDCYLPDNDARFVFQFVRRAMESGCVAANYLEVRQSRFENGCWRVELIDRHSDETFHLSADTLINACGPWVDDYNRGMGQNTSHRHVFSKGVHLIVDRLTDEERILAFFASDGRLFFVIPMGDKTCIGTTDTPVETPDVQVTPEDRQFILDNANDMLDLDRPLTLDDIIAERCGVRPLAVTGGGKDGKGKKETGDWLSLSRKHAIETDPARRFIGIYGGKLTDCLNVGEEVVANVESLGTQIPSRGAKWYGEPSADEKARFLARAQQLLRDIEMPAGVGEPPWGRFWRRYGHLAFSLLDDIATNPRALEQPAASVDYTRGELALMARTEMIVNLEDFLRRRTQVAMLVREAELVADPGMLEVCQILFGERAEVEWQGYCAARESAVPQRQVG